LVKLGAPQTVLTTQAAGEPLRLVHPRLSDFTDWAALRRANIEYLRPWEPDVSTAGLNKTAYRARVSRLKKLVQQDRAYPFYIYFEGVIIGACNVTHVDRGVAQSARLGYWVGQDFTGRGFAQAAVRAVTEFCFKDLGLHRVDAAVQCDNAASIKVLRASGFTHEGTARGFLKINGAWRDHDIYARLNGD